MRKFVICVVFMLFFFGVAVGKEKTKAEKLYDKANAEYYAENYPEALNIYIDALEQAAKERNDNMLISCTGYIGNIYDAFGDNNSCLYYYMKGYGAAKRIRNFRLQADFLSNIVTCYTRMGRVVVAKKYYGMFRALPDTAFDVTNHYYNIYIKARILAAEHHYDEALREHRNALQFAEKHRMKQIFRLFQLSEIGNLYVRMGRAHDAVAIGDSCEEMSKSIGSNELLVNAYKMLADAYTQMQQTTKARQYREMYFDLNDSVYNIKKFYKARYKLSEYENREHRNQVSQLNERISLQTWIIIMAITILLLVLGFSYIIYKNNRHLNRTQRLLISKNKDLEERDSQNRILLKQYLEQLEKNRMKSQMIGENPYTEDQGVRADHSQGEDAEHDDNLDKQLLSQINDVMGNISVISSPDFSLQTLAEMVGSNTSYVSRVINNSYHKNFKTLLNETRIREACHKLANHEQYAGYTMQVIYEEVGYRSASSFIRAFKKVYNMTPSEFQKLASEENKELHPLQ